MAQARKNTLQTFLTKYPGTTEVTNGLAAWVVTKPQVDSDLASINTLGQNASDSMALQVSEVDLKTTGELLYLYKPQMERHVEPNLIPFPERKTNAYQDLLNAACLNLQGLDSDTGTAKYTTVADIKAVVNVRIKTAEMGWNRNVPHNAETTSRLEPGTPGSAPNPSDAEVIGAPPEEAC